VPAQTIVQLACEIAAAAPAFSSHIWRAAAAGNLHGWQVTRALWLLNVLTGSVGTEGGVSPNAWDKFIPAPWRRPDPVPGWNELIFPREYPLAHNEMSFLYPHLLLDGRGSTDVLFTRVLNPVWTYPDGYAWINALRDEQKIGMHAALTPTWSETAWWADYVLPMGHGPERHDTQSYETHAGRWLGFRQPVRRVAMERMGRPVQFTHEANPGEVWEEGEFWIELSWRCDADGSLGIRRYYESPYRLGEKIRLEEYYRWVFENSVPGLPEKAAAEGLSPLEYMRRYGAVEVSQQDYSQHESEIGDPGDTELMRPEATVRRCAPADGHMPLTGDPDTVGVRVDGTTRRGFNTPSGKLELYSEELEAWGWPELATPTYARSHVHHSLIDPDRGEYLLLPTYRLPTPIHTRSGNAKHLNELSHTHPLLVYPEDAERIAVATGDLVRVETEIGYFVIKALVTDGIRPGVVAASHHMGRWRLKEAQGNERWSSALVRMSEDGGTVRFRQVHGVQPWESADPSSRRVWWSDAGVHQNITFPVHPDPVSGMHCWHQKVRVAPARDEDRYGDILVDLNRSRDVYRKWRALVRPAAGELRRPLWLFRQLKPSREAYRLPTTRRPSGRAKQQRTPAGRARSSSRRSSTGRRSRRGATPAEFRAVRATGEQALLLPSAERPRPRDRGQLQPCVLGARGRDRTCRRAIRRGADAVAARGRAPRVVVPHWHVSPRGPECRSGSPCSGGDGRGRTCRGWRNRAQAAARLRWRRGLRGGVAGGRAARDRAKPQPRPPLDCDRGDGRLARA
jgi:hypothetical protein